VPLTVAALGDSMPMSATIRGGAALIHQIPIWRARLAARIDQVSFRVGALGDSMLISATIPAGAALIDQIPICRAALGGPH
jgi:arginine exporter protein ArgO